MGSLRGNNTVTKWEKKVVEEKDEESTEEGGSYFVLTSSDMMSSSRSLQGTGAVGKSSHNLVTQLFGAVVADRQDKVKFLLDQGVSVNLHSEEDQSPLMVSLRIKKRVSRDRMFTYLIVRGADCYDVDERTGRDVLAWASYYGHPRQVRQILSIARSGVDLNRRDRDGKTCLHLAVIGGHLEVTSLLVQVLNDYGLTLDVPDSERLTPYASARRHGHIGIARLLANHGACTSRIDSGRFRTADDWAAIGQKERLLAERRSRDQEHRLRVIDGGFPLPPIRQYRDKKSWQHRGSEENISQVASNSSRYYHSGVKTRLKLAPLGPLRRKEEESEIPLLLVVHDLFNIKSDELSSSYRPNRPLTPPRSVQLTPPTSPLDDVLSPLYQFSMEAMDEEEGEDRDKGMAMSKEGEMISKLARAASGLNYEENLERIRSTSSVGLRHHRSANKQRNKSNVSDDNIFGNNPLVRADSFNQSRALSRNGSSPHQPLPPVSTTQ